MNDTSLTTLSWVDFERSITEALKACREGFITRLDVSYLAQSRLVTDCLWGKELPRHGELGRVLYSILRWAVTQIRPLGEPNPKLLAWRPYFLLQWYYFDGRRVADIADALGLVENYIYTPLKQAITAVAQTLYDELQNPRSLLERKNFVLAERYKSLSPDEQCLLRAASIFTQPIPQEWLGLLVKANRLNNPAASLSTLINAQLLQLNPPSHKLSISPDLKTYITPFLTQTEQLYWHRLAARLYIEQEQAYLEAITHWRAAKDFRQAAEIIIQHQLTIIAQNGLNFLQNSLMKFNFAELQTEEDLWYQLKLLSGHLAESLQNFSFAVAEYKIVLSSSNPNLKAEAYQRIAKAYELSQKVDETLATYQRGITFLESYQPTHPYLATFYIHRAWLYIQTRPNLTLAQSDLQQATSYVQPNDLLNQADLHNAWAGFYIHLQPNPDKSLNHVLQYWLLAQEIGDTKRLLTATLNLGQEYLYQQKYNEAQTYLTQGLELAIKSANRSSEAQYHKVIGASYFFQEKWSEALDSYFKAYAIFKELGNLQWLAHTCHDIAETYAQYQQWADGQYYWQEGYMLAIELGEDRVRAYLEQLATNYPLLKKDIFHRNAQKRLELVIQYMNQNKTITNRKYQKLMGVSKPQAARDLKKMVQQGVLTAVGRSSATYYILNITNP